MSKRRATLPGGPFSRSVAAVLTAAFEDSKLTQTTLGALIGQSQSQMSKYLKAERRLNLDELDALCTALGLDIAEVVRAAKIGEVQNQVQEPGERENPRPDFGV